MKNTARALFASVLMSAMLATALQASAQVSVSLNGQTMNIVPPPIEQGGRVFVPLRSVFQGLGAGVVYANGVINMHVPGREISLKVGSTLASVNGVATAVDTPPFIVGSHTYVPLRFISQALGAGVQWNNATRTVAIDTMGPPPPGFSSLIAGARLSGTLNTDLNTGTAHVGDPFVLNMTPPYPNDDTAFANAYISGHVASVTPAGQGRKAEMELAFDKIVFADGHTLPVSGRVVAIEQKKQSAVQQQMLGALGGMVVGNILGKMVGTNIGGAVGAAGGFLYANNLKTNFTVPKSSTVTLEVEVPHRQSGEALPPPPPPANPNPNPNPDYPGIPPTPSH